MTQTRKRSERVASALPLAMFRALADPNRLHLLAWLALQREPRTVSEIVASGCCSVDFSVISRHLRTLHAAGVVDAARRGREVRYRLGAPRLIGLLRDIADLIERCCPPSKDPPHA